ncbi:IS66 family insertion sequence element accessory protein TnpB, partial [Burkholderia thailandensis]|nr:IS66 family insertion sequence element accessory protein TnpB [Burkholderia thailandensis]
VTDMRSGFNSLAAKVQTVLERDPFSGHVFVFRGKRGDLVKVLWWSGDGMCLLMKRLERGRFVWPRADGGVVCLSQAQSQRRTARLGSATSTPMSTPPTGEAAAFCCDCRGQHSMLGRCSITQVARGARHGRSLRKRSMPSTLANIASSTGGSTTTLENTFASPKKLTAQGGWHDCCPSAMNCSEATHVRFISAG